LIFSNGKKAGNGPRQETGLRQGGVLIEGTRKRRTLICTLSRVSITRKRYRSKTQGGGKKKSIAERHRYLAYEKMSRARAQSLSLFVNEELAPPEGSG